MKTNDDAAITEYATALQFYLTYVPSGDAPWDGRIWERILNADTAIREGNLRGTPAYENAVLRADRIAFDIREQMAKSGG
jgi:hypothetical protein